MNLKQFIEIVQQSPDLSGRFVCTFQLKEHSPLFFSRLYARLKSQSHEIASLDCELASLDAIKANLEMSFLGGRLVYFIKNVHSLEEAQKRSWESFVKKYAGPHCIIYAKLQARGSKAKAAAKEIVVSIDTASDEMLGATALSSFEDAHIAISVDQVDISLYQQLSQFLYPDLQLDRYFLMELFNRHESLSLDDACRMMAYQATVGRKYQDFFADWLDKLIVPQKSFFTLSQYLFAKRPQLFFEQWNLCKGEYPPEFWIAYWSGQLWEAMLYVQRARAQGVIEAKKSTYKLPFSFLNKDWSLYTPATLAAAHEALYRFDFNLKNGGTGNGLELWYHRFLSNV